LYAGITTTTFWFRYIGQKLPNLPREGLSGARRNDEAPARNGSKPELAND
jgi:hypothetical protein